MKKFILSLLFISSVAQANELSFFGRAGAYVHSKLFGLDVKVTGSPETVSLPHDLYPVSLHALGTGETKASLESILHKLATEVQTEPNAKFALINALTNHTTDSCWDNIARRKKFRTIDPKKSLALTPPASPDGVQQDKITGAVFVCQVAEKLFVGVDGQFKILSDSDEKLQREIPLGNRSYQVYSFTPSVGFEVTVLDPMSSKHFLKITS